MLCFQSARPAALALALVVGIASANTVSVSSLPTECHPKFVEAISRAEKSATKEPQLSIALLKGVVYPDGVTVKLDASSAGADRDIVSRACWRAVGVWEQALEGQSPIIFVADDKSANVVVRMVDALPAHSHHAVGLIEMEKEYAWNKVQHKVETKGTISVQRTWAGKKLTEDQLTEVIAHELGHLLGLADVETVGVLMGPMVPHKCTLAPAQHEVAALRSLRRAAGERLDALTKPKPKAVVAK